MTFSEKVYEVVKKIPLGKVATYGQVAMLAGNPRASRAVGMCMKGNKEAPVVPCHRVVGADGKMVGYSAGNGVETKIRRLKDEGVVFSGGKVDMKKSGWIPKNIVL